MTQAVTGNKAELANHLGITLPTLTRWIFRYGAEFPIKERGSNGRDYVFDFAAVFDFLSARRDEQKQAAAEKDEQLAQLRLPFDVPGAPEPVSAAANLKQEIMDWQLRGLKRQEAEKAKALVPAEPAEAYFLMVLGRISKDTHAFLRQLGRKNSWPLSYTQQVCDEYADLQRVMKKDLGLILGKPADSTQPEERKMALV